MRQFDLRRTEFEALLNPTPKEIHVVRSTIREMSSRMMAIILEPFLSRVLVLHRWPLPEIILSKLKLVNLDQEPIYGVCHLFRHLSSNIH